MFNGQISVVNPRLVLNTNRDRKNIFQILERENSLLGVLGQIIMHVNPVNYTFTSNAYTRKSISDYLNVSPNTYDRNLQKLHEKRILIKHAKGIYSINRNYIEILYKNESTTNV